MTLSFLAFLLLTPSCLIYYAEHDAQPDLFSSITNRHVVGIATLTTVGYGDVYPVTGVGQLIASFIAILGIGMFALPIVILGFMAEIEKKEEV